MYVSSCIRGQLVLQEREREREKRRKGLELNLEHSYCLNLHSVSNALFIHHSAIP